MEQKKAVIITGAAAGLGEAIAYRLANDGYAIAAFDIDINGAETVAKNIIAEGGRASYARVDVTDSQSVQAGINQVLETHGSVYAAVNNAGIARAVSFLEITDEQWDRTQAVNTRGVFLMCRYVAPHLVSQGFGSLINMSSIAGRDGYAKWTDYTTSKHAVIGLTRALARELGPDGVRVNSVCPGAVQTQMWGAEAQQSDDPDALLAALAERMSLRRPQTREDVAGTVAFLLSDDAASITGQSLGVDGGLVLW